MKPVYFILFAIALHIAVRTVPVPDNMYFAGMSVVMLLWVYISGKEFSKAEKILKSWWLFWIVNDVIKEVANLFGFLPWLFLNPTQKYLSEYIVFGISTYYLYRKLRK